MPKRCCASPSPRRSRGPTARRSRRPVRSRASPSRCSTPSASRWVRACWSSRPPRRRPRAPDSTRWSRASEDRIPRTRIYGVIGGLEHLQRGGRIGGARALVGSLLNIKPVIQLKDGEVAEESKQRTRARALGYMIDKVRADAPLERIAVADGACDDFADVLASMSRHRHRAPAARGGPRAGRRHPRRAQHGGRLLHRPCQDG